MPAPPPEPAEDRGHRNPSLIPDALLTAFAHEMRNALGPVRTAAYLLRASTADDAQARWSLDLIDRQVQAITASIEELADVARLARGTLELDSEPTDLCEAIDRAAAACAATLAEKRQTLEWTRPDARIAVHGDRARLSQALAAVLRTASRAAPAGTRIFVRLGRATEEIDVEIAGAPDSATIGATQAGGDSGAGGDSIRGLASVGLTLAQAIVARHRGSFVALGGSRFAIRLPCGD